VRYRDTGNYYLVYFSPASDRIDFLKKVNNGSLVTIATKTGVTIDSGIFYEVKVAAYANTFRVWFAGQLVDWDGATATVITDGALSTGNICMYGWNISAAYFDDVVVEPTCGCGGALP
jgi:hypothetical protein